MTVDRGKTDTDPETTQETGERAYEAGRASVPEHSTREYPQVTSRDADERDDLDARERAYRDAPARGDRMGLPTRALRGLFWLVATVGLVLALVVGAQSVGWLPEFKNPFKEQTTDRSQPPLLQSIQDLSRYVAAEGNFQVIIDVQQNQKYVPDFLVNDRVLFVAAGTVDSYVDFGNIGSGALKESADRRSVEVTLPAPQLGKPNLDPARSQVYSRERGLLNRLGDVFKDDPSRMQEVYKLAEERLTAAATESGLRERAQENTTKMLEGLLKSLGYTAVTVKYQAP
ncbi:hypothetical protein Val02_13320 [Virgisporangium aliadipatigenens]|uniref:DUF4230 domain-containing protein n=1 Tax=Virgisporangium aliadipatigenens TaxID=741659 RepID=A0A8J3YG69_9ACTN|nr:DUF4230 domain-containing protein [Virgisporangium aliadipatigenens]GIJ44446.1 hypothetical protein Val02_13320 [Virgisporangium aliadipatigenens]